MTHRTRFSCLLAAGAIALSTQASALLVDFSVISPPNSSAADLAGVALFVNIEDAGAGSTTFQFLNVSSVSAVITKIYFDDNALGVLAGGVISASTGTVNYVFGSGGPSNLPGGNNIGFSATTIWNSHATAPSPTNGINPGETLTMTFASDAASVVAAIQSGALRIGMHVQAIGEGGNSDAFYNNPPGGGPNDPGGGDPVAEPATMTLLGLGLLGAALRRRIRV